MGNEVSRPTSTQDRRSSEIEDEASIKLENVRLMMRLGILKRKYKELSDQLADAEERVEVLEKEKRELNEQLLEVQNRQRHQMNQHASQMELQQQIQQQLQEQLQQQTQGYRFRYYKSILVILIPLILL